MAAIPRKMSFNKSVSYLVSPLAKSQSVDVRARRDLMINQANALALVMKKVRPKNPLPLFNSVYPALTVLLPLWVALNKIWPKTFILSLDTVCERPQISKAKVKLNRV